MDRLCKSKLMSMSKAQLINHINEMYRDKDDEAKYMDKLLKMLEYAKDVVTCPYVLSLPAAEIPYMLGRAPKMSNVAEQGLLIVSHNRLKAATRLIENDCIDEALQLLNLSLDEIHHLMLQPDCSKDVVEDIIATLQAEVNLSDEASKFKQFLYSMLERMHDDEDDSDIET